MLLRRLGELLGPGKPENRYTVALPNSNATVPKSPTERKRNHAARLLAEFSDVVDEILATDERGELTTSVLLSRLTIPCWRCWKPKRTNASDKVR